MHILAKYLTQMFSIDYVQVRTLLHQGPKTGQITKSGLLPCWTCLLQTKIPISGSLSQQM